MRHDSVLLVEVAIGLGVISLLSIPAVLAFASQLRNRVPKKDTYEDEDGRATPEALAAFSNKWAKAFVFLSAGVGLGSQIAVAVLAALQNGSGGLLEDWLALSSWALLMAQAVAIVASRSSVTAYNLGLYSASSSIVLFIVLLQQNSQVLIGLVKDHPVSFALRIVSNVAAVFLVAPSMLLPRRPDVYYKNRIIDRMFTNSAYSRFTFSWPINVLDKAREKKDLEAIDLPKPNHHTRAEDQAAAWRRYNLQGPLWKALLWVYAWPIALQWALCTISSVVSFAPYLITLSILRIMETKEPGESLPSSVWFLVVWLGISILAQAGIEANMWWLSWSELGVPMRGQLSAIIFEKSMRRKNVKGTSKSEKDKDDDKKKDKKPNDEQPAASDAKKDGKKDEEEEEDDPTGQKSRQAVINLIGVDASRISMFAMFQFLFPQAAAKLAMAVWFLVYLIGWIPLGVGFLTWLIIIPVNTFFAKRYAAAQDRLMKVRDQKLAIINESLQGIRQIKFSALEAQWQRRIMDSREKELKACWDVFANDTVLFGCWVTSPIALAAASLAVYAIMHGGLTPSVAFVSIGVFKSLEVTLSVIPELMTDVMDCWISMKRIDKYLKGPEISKVTKNNTEVAFENASLAWPVDEETPEAERFVLRNVDFTFPKGELSVISGKTGTGKSLMLAAILGESDLLAGSIYTPDAPTLDERQDQKANRDNWILPASIAFVGQIPWIENATLKDNILFGLPMDEDRYQATISACALKKDFDMLTDGDKTELGANGINLSGGQKWRVTLARAIYSRAGILVMDDIFSAVDAHVGRHIYEKCLTGDLCKGRTRILVTHHVALCEPKTKFFVELGDGVVLNSGLKSELEEDGVLDKIKSHEQSQQEIAEEEALTAVNSDTNSQAEGQDAANGDGGEDAAPLKKVPSKAVAPQKFVEEEARERGAIKTKVYSTYLHDSGGWVWWFGSGLLFLTCQVLVVGRSWWVRIWTGHYEEQSIQTYEDHHYAYALTVQQTGAHTMYQPVHATAQHSLAFYLTIYVGLALVSAVIGTLRFFYMFRMSIKASKRLFEKMTFTVLRTPLRWLDTVPVGRILNRFTADFNIVDNRLAVDVAMTINAGLGVIGICVASLFVTPYIIAFALILLLWCGYIAMRYLHGARPVKRLESTTKSPIFELFGSALTGVSTIRGFDKSKSYIERMNERLDDYDMATWHLWLFNRWMGWRMSIVGMLFSTVVAVVILVTPDMDAALAGFSLSFALDFSSAILWFIRAYASIELDMNAAERVIEYSDLKTEDLKGDMPPAAWPTEGRLEVNDLVVGYAPELPPVLKGLTFSVRRNERVGVIGRTGAGKSSLTLALFRFLEPRSGSIHVDGLDISKISLHELRSRLAIIPQDPVLFSGTVRSNLDPFDDHSDAELRDSLLRVHLITEEDTGASTPTEAAEASTSTAANGTDPTTPATPATPKNPKNVNVFRKLTSAIAEGGLNLSQGQRQLLCLARAIVSRPKIMVLDEATSAVDMTTDALIQRSIREEFGDSTLVVIAHRLSTIADFDRILVLSDGAVAEFGTPRELWDAGAGGVFRGMCEESGEKEKLRKIIFGEVEASSSSS